MKLSDFVKELLDENGVKWGFKVARDEQRLVVVMSMFGLQENEWMKVMEILGEGGDLKEGKNLFLKNILKGVFVFRWV